MIIPHNDERYWKVISEGIESRREEAAEAGIDIRIFVPQLNYNLSQMTDLLRQQIAAKADVIAVQGSRDSTFRNLLLEAHRRGIQIICIDTDMDDFPSHLYVGTDNYQAGWLVGKELSEACAFPAEVAVISGGEDYPNLSQRLDGIRDAAADRKDIHFREVRYDEYDAYTFMNLYYEEADADVLICLEGTGALTLSSRMAEPERSYEKIFGFDITDGIASGVLDGVLVQDPMEMGKRMVEQIIIRRQNGEYDSDRIYTDIHWVTEDNYSEEDHDQTDAA